MLRKEIKLNGTVHCFSLDDFQDSALLHRFLCADFQRIVHFLPEIGRHFRALVFQFRPWLAFYNLLTHLDEQVETNLGKDHVGCSGSRGSKSSAHLSDGECVQVSHDTWHINLTCIQLFSLSLSLSMEYQKKEPGEA